MDTNAAVPAINSAATAVIKPAPFRRQAAKKPIEATKIAARLAGNVNRPISGIQQPTADNTESPKATDAIAFAGLATAASGVGTGGNAGARLPGTSSIRSVLIQENLVPNGADRKSTWCEWNLKVQNPRTACRDSERRRAEQRIARAASDALQVMMPHKGYKTTQGHINLARQMNPAVQNRFVPELPLASTNLVFYECRPKTRQGNVPRQSPQLVALS